MKLYRKKRLGMYMAKMLFERFPGRWEIRQLPNAKEAHFFWLKTLQHHSSFFSNYWLDNPKWKGWLQILDTSQNSN